MSLRLRLLGLWLMSLFGSVVVAVLIVFLFRQTVAAHRQRDRAVAARACEAIGARYDFYTAGMAAPPADAAFDAGLRAVLVLALRREQGMAGGIEAASGAPRATVGTIPANLTATIGGIVSDAVAADRLVVHAEGGFFDTTTIAACPLGGPVDNLAGFTVLRADLLRSNFTRFAFAGLAVLMATLLASAAFLARLVLGFSRRLAGVEAALSADRPGTLPLTGEAELDRLIAALNAANARLDAARARIAQSERLSALGRMASGLAHEIRNPLGAIRLRAEGALAGDAARRRAALERILVESARLETLTSRLLGFAASRTPQPVATPVATMFAEAIAAQAPCKHDITVEPTTIIWTLDPILTASALDNLVRNAVQACRTGDIIRLAARIEIGHLVLTVADTGPGLDMALGDPFEPFVTGRADGIGLGLAIARDMIRAQGGTLNLRAGAQGGTLNLRAGASGAIFEITLPEAAS